MRLFDFVFGPLVLPLQISTPAKVSYSSPPLSGNNSAPRRIQQSGVATAGWQPERRMSEHIILATLPGQAVSAVTLPRHQNPCWGRR